jgi:hypothetical protein
MSYVVAHAPLHLSSELVIEPDSSTQVTTLFNLLSLDLVLQVFKIDVRHSVKAYRRMRRLTL